MVQIQKQKQYWIWRRYQDNELIARSQYSQYRARGVKKVNFGYHALQDPNLRSPSGATQLEM